MKTLNYCPECGEKQLSWDGEKKWYCSGCGFTLYNNVAGAVAVVIRYQNEIFLTKRNQEPKKGFWDLSGGFTDPKESAEQTCVRELREELNIHIDESKLKYLTSLPNVYHYKGIDYNTLDLFYEYTVDEKFEAELELSEISDSGWIPLQDIRLEDIAFDSQKMFFKEYISSL